MSILDDKQTRDGLRKVLFNAQDSGVLTEGEIGFVLALAKRFKSDIEKKERQVYQMKGEVNQLKINLNIIVEMVENLIAAEERAKARIETAKKLREDREDKENKENKENKEDKEDKEDKENKLTKKKK